MGNKIICADIVTVNNSKIYFMNELLTRYENLNWKTLLNKTIPIVPPKDNINPTSHMIKGLYKRIKNAVEAIVEKVLGALHIISDKIKIMAIIPARTTEGLAPEINTKSIIIIIEQ